MQAKITHFVRDVNDDISAQSPAKIELGEAANMHHVMRKVHERLTPSQIPKGAVSTIIIISHSNPWGK